MFAFGEVYVSAEAVDFRLGIDGLALLVQATVGAQAALSGTFVFFNRGRDKVKLLRFDRHGWWLHYKRLERGRFAPVSTGVLSVADLGLVLEGVPLSTRRLAKVSARRVA